MKLNKTWLKIGSILTLGLFVIASLLAATTDTPLMAVCIIGFLGTWVGIYLVS